MGKDYENFSYETDTHNLYYGRVLKGLVKSEELFNIWTHKMTIKCGYNTKISNLKNCVGKGHYISEFPFAWLLTCSPLQQVRCASVLMTKLQLEKSGKQRTEKSSWRNREGIPRFWIPTSFTDPRTTHVRNRFKAAQLKTKTVKLRPRAPAQSTGAAVLPGKTKEIILSGDK